MNEIEKSIGSATTDWIRLWAERTTDYSIFALTPDGDIASWNLGGELIHGYRTHEILGQHVSILYTEDDRLKDIPNQSLRRAEQEGRHEIEGWRITKDGNQFWANSVITALNNPDGELIGYAEIVRDTSDKKAAHDAAIDSERRFRILVQGVTDYAIYMLSPQGHVTNWNQGARRIKGYTAEQVVGTHFSRFYTAADAAAGMPQHGLETAAREGRFETEGWRVRADGTKFWAHIIIDAIHDDGGILVGFAKITRDITERRNAAELLEQTRAALFQSQKMEAIGKLTGGVAHDFNNVLQILRGNLELLEARYSRDPWSRERLEKAIEAVERGATLASQLLAFGRRQTLRPVVVNLAGVIRDMDDLLRRALGETIQIETVSAGGLWNTLVDTHQLENVILNLAINARDAMPDGGKLTVELANVMLDDHYVLTTVNVPAGQYVMLGVTDTGAGMPPEVTERAFDPFFTTKPEGQGTGLGLSMAYGFVKQSGGHIRIYSEIDHGTTIKIYLPRSMEAATVLGPRLTTKLVGGKETILVVEDDRKVQATVVDTLSQLGYTVLRADDAQSALAVIHSGVHIDLLFTDVVMPGSLRSPEMARQAVETLPGLKVLFTSGYTQNAIVHGGRLDAGVELLSKPYSREQLAYKVRKMLGAIPAATVAAQSGESSGQKAEIDARPDPSQHVLVVEDDSVARDSLCEILRMLGHDVAGVDSGEEALDRLSRGTFDVMLTDLHLTGMSGIDLAQQAHHAYRDLHIIFSSGHEIPDDAVPDFRWKALRKPYTLQQLEEALQRA